MNQVIDEPNGGTNEFAAINIEPGVVVREPPSNEIEVMPLNVVVSRTIVPSPKKRKSSSIILDGDDDDGSTCSICLDNWELAGPHRLTSLKCGHLFGYACIKRWMEENSARNRLCPRCKKRATQRDFRFIYPKRVVAIDNSVEVRLREQLKLEREKSIKLELEYSLNLKFERDKCIDLQERLSNLQQILASFNDMASPSSLCCSLSHDPE